MPRRASMATWRTSSFERGMERLSLGSPRQEHPRGCRAAADRHRERAPADQDQREPDPIDGRRLAEEAEHEPSPPEQRPGGGDQDPPPPSPHVGSNALNCSSSRMFTFNFSALSSLEPAPGPATT